MHSLHPLQAVPLAVTPGLGWNLQTGDFKSALANASLGGLFSLGARALEASYDRPRFVARRRNCVAVGNRATPSSAALEEPVPERLAALVAQFEAREQRESAENLRSVAD